MALTSKQKKFCENLAKGMSDTEAFINAGYSKKNAQKNAYHEKVKPHVFEYFKKLTEPHEKETALNISQIKEKLTEIINDDDNSTCDKLKAIDLLCKISGVYNKDTYEIKKAELELKKAEFELKKKAFETEVW